MPHPMRNILIIEDEQIAAKHLARLIVDVMPNDNIVAVLQTIEESVEYLQQNPMPDLCFLDIRLADGLSFRIFDSVKITCPIIFTTAYDEYALEAFKVNSIDYLLKPINRADLQHALDKLSTLTALQPNIDPLIKALRSNPEQRYRTHFLIPVLDKLVPINVSDIAFLYLEEKITRAVLSNSQQYVIDRPLDAILEQLDPTLFFRANRQYIIARKFINEIAVWPIGKLAIGLSTPPPTRIIISKARVPEFKKWYTK